VGFETILRSKCYILREKKSAILKENLLITLGITMKHPVKVYLEKGKTYHFCTCGKSADGVLCDGSHKGTKFVPKEFIATRNSEGKPQVKYTNPT